MIEPIAIKEYSSPRKFSIFYVSWPGALVLHSHGGVFVGEAIDLIFLSTDYVELPFEVQGLRVSQPLDESAAHYELEFGVPRRLEQAEGKRVFIIESEGRRFHIIAAKMWVLVRTHKSRASLLQRLFDDDLQAREAFINTHVKEWYRMTALYD